MLLVLSDSVPSQRIKDVLPKEIIDRIRASSQRSRTIAIVEPANRFDDSSNDSTSDKSVGDERVPSPKRPKTEHSVLSPTSNHLATRFQEAASSLNKSKQLRQMGIIAPASNSHQVSQFNSFTILAQLALKLKGAYFVS